MRSKLLYSIFILVVAALAMAPAVFGQDERAARILADARKALGGDSLERLQALAIEGRTARVGPNGTIEREFEINLELPDKFMRREVLAAMGTMSVYRISGFNGPDGLINEIDQPPQLGGGNMIVRFAGAGAPSNGEATPEQREAQRATALLANKKEYARLALGLLAAAPSTFPLSFAYAGEAESPDGSAHVIDVTGEGGFAARLFVDTRTSLPLMLTWMDKEPLVMNVGGPSPAGAGPVHAVGGGGGQVEVRAERIGGGQMSPEEREKMMQDLDARVKEAEARRQTVEYRLFYGNYKPVRGVMIPHSLQRSIDGKPTEHVTFERVRVDPKIDQRKFQVSK
jgi:hypothetical protein